MRAITKCLPLLWLFIMLRSKRRTYFYVGRKALVSVQRSPWKKLVQRDWNEEFMLYLGINRSDFEILLSAFNQVWPRKRTRIFSSRDVLGLSLVWMNSTCRQKHLCSMFAMTQGCVSYSPWTSWWLCYLGFFECTRKLERQSYRSRSLLQASRLVARTPFMCFCISKI